MEKVFLLLGTNLGSRKENLQLAFKILNAHALKIKQYSSVYETAAWGKTDQQPFLNQVLEIETAIAAEDLLTCILYIEKKMGRSRVEKWGERLIDIDILFYASSVIKSPRLSIPHPYLQERRFTLVPLVEIAPDFVHPTLNKDMRELLNDCEDSLDVRRIE